MRVDDGEFGCYQSALPDNPRPAVIVVQEILGVTPFIQKTADDFANEGYMALAPDLFWRHGAWISLDPSDEGEFARALELYQATDPEVMYSDIAATMEAARAHPSCDGRIGLIGFCLGGLMAYLASERGLVDVSVGYYPVSVETRLDGFSKSSSPLQLHLGAEDELVSPEAQESISAVVGAHAASEVHIYESCGHAFAREGMHHNGVATVLANDRSKAFFRSYLG